MLDLNDPQLCLLLLRSCEGMPKLVYFWRTCPPEVLVDQARRLEDEILLTLRWIVVGDGPYFSDFHRTLATLPLACGGLGVTKPTDMLKFAYAASAIGSFQLQQMILHPMAPSSEIPPHILIRIREFAMDVFATEHDRRAFLQEMLGITTTTLECADPSLLHCLVPPKLECADPFSFRSSDPHTLQCADPSLLRSSVPPTLECAELLAIETPGLPAIECTDSPVLHTLVPPTVIPAVPKSVVKVQRYMSEKFFQKKKNSLWAHNYFASQNLHTQRQFKAIVDSNCMAGTSAWLLALPNAGLRQQMTPLEFQAALNIRLLIPQFIEGAQCNMHRCTKE